MRHFLPYLLILFALAALLRVDFFFTIAYLFFALYLLARWWMGRIEKGLRVERHFTPRAFYGDQVEVLVNLHNHSRLPAPWLEVRESLPLELATPPFQQQVLSFNPQEKRQLRYTLDCRRRGYHAVGPLHAYTGDMLGLAERRLSHPKQFLIVYPRIVPLVQLGLPTRSPLAILKTPTPLFEDTARVISVREYQRGDSPRKIHWTASASAGQLLVKQYQPAIARETMIALDLNFEDYETRGRYTAMEMAITVAASIATHTVVRQRLPTGLFTDARDALTRTHTRFFLPPRTEQAHLAQILESLARVNFTEQAAPFASVLRRESVHLAWGTTLLAITGRIDTALLQTLGYLKRSGFAVAAIAVQYEHILPALQAQAKALGIKLYPVWTDLDLKEL